MITVEAIRTGCPALAEDPAGAMVARALAAALHAACPRSRTAEAIRAWHREGPCAAVAVGKAAYGMLAGARDALGPSLVAGLAVAKHSPPSRSAIAPWPLHLGDHPVPGPRSIACGAAIERFLADLPRTLPLLVLLSGGASSLAVLPAKGVRLCDLAHLTQWALAMGLPIETLNAVRMRLDRLKAGGLARLAAPRPVRGYVLSDIVAGPATLVGSSPLWRPPASAQVPPRVAANLPLPPTARRNLAAPVPPTPVVPFRVVGSPHAAATAAADSLRRDGSGSVVLRRPRTGSAREAARQLVATLPKGIPGAVVVPAETTVEVRGTGVGGRCTEFALASALALAEEDHTGTGLLVACFATDGDDGPTGLAGAVVTPRTVGLLEAVGVDPQRALEANDSATALAAAGAVLDTGPTGTNVADLVVALSRPAP